MSSSSASTSYKATSLRLCLLFILLFALGAGGCVQPGISTDGAIIQEVQRTKERLLAEPGMYPDEVLWIDRTAAIARGEDPDDVGNKGFRGLGPAGRPSSKVEQLQAQAMEEALRAKLLLGQGESEKARTALNNSMSVRPNLYALEELAPLWRAEKSEEALRSACERSLQAALNNGDRLRIFALCTRYQPTALGRDAPTWATSEDLLWYQEEVARRLFPSEEETPKP